MQGILDGRSNSILLLVREGQIASMDHDGDGSEVIG